MRTLPVIVACLLSTNGFADDWPEWMGPRRDNIWREVEILDQFPEGGPEVLWRTKVAGGYAGPAVVGDKVFVTDYSTSDNVKVSNFNRKTFSGVERVLCLDEATGKKIWEHKYPVKYSISYPAGPRCTPTVRDGLVYTLGAEGHLFCFEAQSGDIVWQKHFPSDYETKSALWGYTNHPLIDGDHLICVVGGEGSHVVAFDRKTGKEVWKSLTAEEQGYSPPSIINAGGKRQLIVTSKKYIASLNPADGTTFWSVPYDATSGSIIMTPVQVGDYLYVGGYSNKNLLLKLAKQRPAVEIVWRDQKRKGISPVNVQPFVDGSQIYGFDQRGTLMAVDIPTGERLWQTSEPVADKRPAGNATAFIVRQADRYFLFTEDGDLVICRLSKAGYQEVDRAKVIEPSNVASGRKGAWSTPAFANRHAYIRNDNEIICIDLTKGGTGSRQ